METIYDESLPVLERIKCPLVWERLASNVRVEDLKETRYEEALKLIETHFIADDPMCKGCRLGEDEESVREFLDLVLHWMQDTQSFIAVENSTDEVVGVLVGRVNDQSTHTKTMSRMAIYQAKTLSKMQRFRLHMHKQVDMFEVYKTSGFFRVYVWCVIPEFRERGIGKALLRSSIEQTKLYKMRAVMGIFTGAVSQNIAKEFGFESHVEILYWQWVEGDEAIFDNPGAGNNSADLMALKIDLGDEPLENEKVEDEQVEDKPAEDEHVEDKQSGGEKATVETKSGVDEANSVENQKKE